MTAAEAKRKALKNATTPEQRVMAKIRTDIEGSVKHGKLRTTIFLNSDERITDEIIESLEKDGYNVKCKNYKRSDDEIIISWED